MTTIALHDRPDIILLRRRIASTYARVGLKRLPLRLVLSPHVCEQARQEHITELRLAPEEVDLCDQAELLPRKPGPGDAAEAIREGARREAERLLLKLGEDAPRTWGRVPTRAIDKVQEDLERPLTEAEVRMLDNEFGRHYAALSPRHDDGD